MANTIDEYIAGLISQAAYTPPDQIATVAGWTDISFELMDQLGIPFYDSTTTDYENVFRVFVNAEEEQIVIAFKGSDKLGNLISDLIPTDQGYSAYQVIA
jgi:hypothetical protein